jgi:3-oxoacyl-[acyl-carrier-protein] synthase III
MAMSAKPEIGVSMIGIGACVPKAVVTNDDLMKLVETSDEWITSRTGIRERRVVSGDETLAHLAVEAAKDALASAGVDGSEIQLIIAASSTPDTIYPGTACQVQHAIGAKNAAGFDLALACTGFVYGVVVAQQFLKTGMFKKALVVGADVHSRYVNWDDRNTCILFGDGAGACVLVAEDGKPDNILASDLHIDGAKGEELTLFAEPPNCPLVPQRDKGGSHVYMNGREVFKFAVGTVPKSIMDTLSRAGLTLDDIQHVVLHQANIRIMQAMSEKLNISQDRMIINLDKYGNTSAASIPIALNEAILDGRVKVGDTVLMCGFGAGLAWGTTVVRWVHADQRLAKAVSRSEIVSPEHPLMADLVVHTQPAHPALNEAQTQPV